MFLSKLEPLFLRTPPTLRNSIVRYQSFPFVGKILFKGILCYPSSYEISRECFICRVFAVFCLLYADGSATFVRIQPINDRMGWNKIMQNQSVFGYASCVGSVLTSVAWRPESMPQRDLWTATGQMERLMKSGILQRESPILYVCF